MKVFSISEEAVTKEKDEQMKKKIGCFKGYVLLVVSI